MLTVMRREAGGHFASGEFSEEVREAAEREVAEYLVYNFNEEQDLTFEQQEEAVLAFMESFWKCFNAPDIDAEGCPQCASERVMWDAPSMEDSAIWQTAVCECGCAFKNSYTITNQTIIKNGTKFKPE